MSSYNVIVRRWRTTNPNKYDITQDRECASLYDAVDIIRHPMNGYEVHETHKLVVNGVEIPAEIVNKLCSHYNLLQELKADRI